MTSLLLAASIFLNGVNIDGVRAQTFEKCRAVRIDDKGNLHLDCPGYQVENPGGAAAAPVVLPSIPVAGASLAPPSLAKHYFLVPEPSARDPAQYAVHDY